MVRGLTIRRRIVSTRQAGLTLMELITSIALIAGMMTIAWVTITTTVEGKRHMESYQERSHEIRMALTRMAQDISMAFLSANEDVNHQHRRTMFVGDNRGSINELRFSSLGHFTPWATANESDQTLISYYGDSDPDKSGVTNLLRRESRRLSNEDWKQEPAELDVLLSDVEKVEFEYWEWEDKEWRKEWDTLSDKKGSLPTRVRITVEANFGDGTQTFSTQARIMMQERMLRIN